MSNWRDDLRFAIADAQKVAVLGAGSILCGDDAAGMLVAQKLQELAGDNPRLLALEGSTAPENFTGVIRNFHPDLLILVDAAYIEGETGDMALLSLEQQLGMSFSTHMLPFGILLDFMCSEIDCRTVVIGIKPDQVEFATEPGVAVSNAASDLAAEIVALIS
jgi:hydrogenase 3 maturation protease